ncbi:MAG TPA: ATP-binding protein [Spirochaetales bacterium]|nr:ATP-binding protein [Spirochaetales bacterium]HRY55248.1 ATP-binding protein [Spirochaetia bacterium]HRZ64207.1 ATP-binding protein [Spirochaetia bacterium]
MYIPRAIESAVLAIAKSFPVLLVTGPRQVGKTTLLRHLAEKGRNYVTLDDPLQRRLAAEEPELFLERFEPPVIIDEIQYAPGLLPYIKMRVDREGTKGAYWLTGSQIFHLMRDASESLAGRVGIAHLLGLSQAELSGRASLPFLPTKERLAAARKKAPRGGLADAFAAIQRGSLPALLAGRNRPETEQYYSSYVQTYLQRDIKDLSQVGDELAFLRFLTAAAARTGQMLQYADLARDIGISQPTAKKWLSLLVTSGIVALVEPWHSNALTRMIKAPKLYFLDTGLAAYLTRWTSPQALEAGASSGAFFETFVVSEIMKSWHNAGKTPPLFYYRDKDRVEIDLILEADGELHPVEIKKSANPGKDAIAAFRVLAKAGKSPGSGGVVCCASEYLPLDAKNAIIPWWMV